MGYDWRLWDLVQALRQEGIPAIADAAGQDERHAVFALIHLQDGTFLLLGEDDEWFLWGRCDGDTGEFTDEDAECDVIERHADPAKAAQELRDLLHDRGWTPVQPPAPTQTARTPGTAAGPRAIATGTDRAQGGNTPKRAGEPR